MYSIRNLFDKEPVALAEVVRQIVTLLVVFAVVDWTDVQIVTVVGTVSIVLGLFIRAKSTPTAQLDEDLAALAEPAKPKAKR